MSNYRNLFFFQKRNSYSLLPQSYHLSSLIFSQQLFCFKLNFKLFYIETISIYVFLPYLLSKCPAFNWSFKHYKQYINKINYKTWNWEKRPELYLEWIKEAHWGRLSKLLSVAWELRGRTTKYSKSPDLHFRKLTIRLTISNLSLPYPCIWYKDFKYLSIKYIFLYEMFVVLSLLLKNSAHNFTNWYQVSNVMFLSRASFWRLSMGSGCFISVVTSYLRNFNLV